MQTATPAHLTHYAYGTAPFTTDELRAIARYEEASGGMADTFDGDVLPEGIWDVKPSREELTDAYRSMFKILNDWYELLDSLKSGLRNMYEGPAHSLAAYRYLQAECKTWYRALHLTRREVCERMIGTAGPRPEMDSGSLTFCDIPGIFLDGTIAAESR